MDDVTNQQPQADAPVPAPATPAPPLRAIPLIPIKVIDSRPPFAPLATLVLDVVPRPGDGITIDLAGRRVFYKVDFVNVDPYDALARVTLGCSPNQPAAAGGQVDPGKINEFIQSQDQAFQKLEAYSKTIITLGYAGLFAIWAFVKDHLSHRAVLTTALLVGSSLIVYIAWEVMQMINLTTLQLRFNRAINDQPADQAKAISDYLAQTRAEAARGARSWRVILILTVVPGFVGSGLLIWNVFAGLTGLSPWP
jgi:hypothetical protein